MSLFAWETDQDCEESHSINKDEMDDIFANQLDAVYLKVDCERGISQELSDFFTFKVPGYQFMPAYRNKMWDGNIRLFNVHDKTIYAGLADYIAKFAADRGYPFRYKSCSTYPQLQLDEQQIAEYLLSLKLTAAGKPITPHPHQISAIHTALNDQRCLLLSPTASGKSLIIYSTIRYLLDHVDQNRKILLIVPTIGLVNQMYSDFLDYSSQNGWDVKRNCQTIFSGQEKTTRARVVISTWQSIFRM